MSTVNILVDTKLVIEGTNKHGPLTGTFSDYEAEAHPGTGNAIVGWEYDSRTWPSNDNDYSTTMGIHTDVDLSLVPDDDFQSGIGQDTDCQVVSIENVLNSGFIDNWFPKVNHGLWFDQDKEYYLYGDYHRSQYAPAANLISGVSFIYMAELPKNAVPILARTYIWNESSEEYLTYINYERRVQFTGSKLTPTSPRQSTWNVNSQSIIFSNIDVSKNEFLISYGTGLPIRLANPGAEDGIGYNGDPGGPVVIPGWTVVTGTPSVLLWANTAGFPTNSDPGPPAAERGLNYFFGGPDSALSVLTQTLLFTGYETLIDSNSMIFNLSAYLGGCPGQTDYATIDLVWKDISSTTISTSTIGPVTETDRDNLNALLLRATSGLVPVGARSVVVTMTMTRFAGSDNDGYVDDIQLTFSGQPTAQIIFNKNVVNSIGNTVSSGADLLTLETLGIADGTDKIYFHTAFSPIDKTQTIQVYTYTTDIDTYQLWTCILNGPLTHTGHQCMVDTDLGIVQFGVAGSGDAVPPATATVLIKYSYTAEVLYETQDTDGLHTAFNKNGDCNPMVRANNRGFVIIDRNEDIPSQIVLTAEAPLISANLYGPIDIGNILIPVQATVTTANGTPVEHLQVTFNITNTILTGHFTNGIDTISTYTNDLGIATTFYDTPSSIDEVSEFIPIAQYATSSGNTILSTQLINVSTTQREIFVYSVWNDDPYQGIYIGDQATLDSGLLTTQLSDFYQTFFTLNEIDGPTGNDPGTGLPEGMLQSGASWWENRRRLLTYILTPVSYNRALRNGRKQIVATWSSSGLDPHYQETGAFVPLQPTTVVNTGPTTNDIHYNGVVLTAPGTGNLDGYLLISPTTVAMYATVYDAFSDRTLVSNTITIELKVSDALNGTVYIDDINAIPANTVPYMLNSGDNGKILPLGFKIRQTGNTLASAIQAVTYIDINPPAITNITFNVDKIV